jgi:hypothetical protein
VKGRVERGIVHGGIITFTFGGREIRVDFAADRTATFSSPVFGSSGRWQRNGREYITKLRTVS